MNSFYDLSMRRQSCRNFADKPVEHEKLVACVEAARLAPSGCNAQPWSFVVVESPEMVAKFREIAQPQGWNAFTSKAQAFILVLEEHARLIKKLGEILDSQYFAKGDLGAVSYALCLAAEDQGLGTCITGMYNREAVQQLLNLPVDKGFGVLIAVGYSAEESVRPKARKTLEEVAKFI